MTSDSEETPAARCAYSVDAASGYVTFSADVPGRFSLEYANLRPYEIRPVSWGTLQVTGGCPEWDSRRSYIELEQLPAMPGDLLILDVHAACNGYSLDGIVGRRRY